MNARRLLRVRNLLLPLGLAMFIDGAVRAAPEMRPFFMVLEVPGRIEAMMGVLLIAVWWVLWKFEQEESRSDAEDAKEIEHRKDDDTSQGPSA